MDPTLLILDVKERETGAVRPPTFTPPKPTPTGFPNHKKRTRVSAFKQQKQSQSSSTPVQQQPSTASIRDNDSPDQRPPSDFASEERRRIDEENNERIKKMSSHEIEEAQQELLSGLSPSILERLLRRANIDDSDGALPFDEPDKSAGEPKQQLPGIRTEEADSQPTNEKKRQRPEKTVSFAATADDAPPAAPPPDLFPIISPSEAVSATAETHDKMHFPHAHVPDLNPDDPNFLQNLHSKYFPNLPADPSKLAWMAPLPTEDSPADRESPYYPRQDSLPVSQLRFDFRGALLPPRVSRAIPVSKGLHHHGEAPESAGYTLPELARLARSAVPAQRCIAFQTLGRILFRLGKGEWGDADSPIAMGLWRCFQEGRVIETLTDAAGVEEGRGHRGSRAYAFEAIWLFEKGGWKARWRGR